MTPDSRWLRAVSLSVVGHALVLATTGAVAAGPPDPGARGRSGSDRSTAADLRGDTFEVDVVRTELGAEPRPPVRAPAAPTEPAATRSEAPAAVLLAPPGPVALPRHPRPAEATKHRADASTAASTGASRRAAAKLLPPHPQAAASASVAKGPANASASVAASSAPPAAASASDGGRRPTAGGTYGAAVARNGRLVLAPFFTRAIPAAVSADPTWSKRPLGSAGAIRITVTIDEAGAIDRVTVPAGADHHLKRLVARTMPLLRAGRFALMQVAGAGQETLRIAVTLSQQEPMGTPSARPTDALELGYEPPVQDRPGRAYFTLASGRHFEAHVLVVSSMAKKSTLEPTTEQLAVDAGVPSGE